MLKTFNELNVDPKILKAVNDLGILDPTPIQQVSLPPILEGKDLIGEAPTGTGKTFAYAIPMVNKIPADSKYVHALVITPTRELAFQSADEIRKLLVNKEGIAVVPLYGGSPIQRQIVSLKKKPNIVVGTPGRLLDHIQRGTLKLAHIDTLVLDECDEMLDMGFIKDIEKIINGITNKHQTILFSATISKEIASISSRFQSADKVSVKVERENKKPIKQWFINVKEDEKYEDLIDLLSSLNFESAFIFARTKHKVSQLQKKFDLTKFKATSLHGNLNQNKRIINLKSFKSKENPILIATDIAARGLDVKDVDIVINYDVPEQDEFYIHRIGRVGRANATGESYVFITKSQKRRLGVYEKMTNDHIEEYVIKNKSDRTNLVKEEEKSEDEHRSFNRRGRSQNKDNYQRRGHYGNRREYGHKKEQEGNVEVRNTIVNDRSSNKEREVTASNTNGERRTNSGNRGHGEARSNRGFNGHSNNNHNRLDFNKSSRYGEKRFTRGSKELDGAKTEVRDTATGEKKSYYGNRRSNKGFGGRSNDNRSHRNFDKSSRYGEKKFTKDNKEQSGEKSRTNDNAKRNSFNKNRSGYKGGNPRNTRNSNKGYQNRKSR